MDENVRTVWVRIDVDAETDSEAERAVRETMRQVFPSFGEQVRMVVTKRGQPAPGEQERE
jgi:hypothetical protein